MASTGRYPLGARVLSSVGVSSRRWVFRQVRIALSLSRSGEKQDAAPAGHPHPTPLAREADL